MTAATGCAVDDLYDLYDLYDLCDLYDLNDLYALNDLYDLYDLYGPHRHLSEVSYFFQLLLGNNARSLSPLKRGI